MSQGRYNWDQIKTEYVEGIIDENGNLYFPTLQELEEKHGMSGSTIRRRASKEGWATEKDIYQTKIREKKREKKVEELARKAAEFDSEVLKVADAAVKHIQSHFLVAQERMRESRGREPMGLSRLEALSKALERYQKIGRLSLGEITESYGYQGQVDSKHEHEFESAVIEQIVNTPEFAKLIKEDWRREVASEDGEG